MRNPFRNLGRKSSIFINSLKPEQKPDLPIKEDPRDKRPIEIERIGDEDKERDPHPLPIGDRPPPTHQPQVKTKPTIISR